MFLMHKIALDPNNKQVTYFSRGCGVARFAYNWALAEWKREYEAGANPCSMSINKRLNAIKREQFPWMYEVTKTASHESIINLGVAFSNFFRDLKKNGQRKSRYPRPKKRGDRESFCAANQVGKFRCNGKRIRLPVIGWVRLREPLRFVGIPKNVTILREADRWFASILVEIADKQELIHQPQDVVGIDLGISNFATLSRPLNGVERFGGAKAHKSKLAKLKRYQRAVSRKRKGSSNQRKARQRLARLHSRIGNIRYDYLHKISTAVVKNFRVVGIEDLNISGLLKNRCLARSIMDEGFRTFRTMLEYKAKLYGARVVVADRFFPSSKTCSCCGSIKQTLSLSTRTFVCEDCDSIVDRDENAAINLERFAASSAVSACGEERSGAVRKSRVKRASEKQEISSEIVCASNVHMKTLHKPDGAVEWLLASICERAI